jgi:hypothetical protein
MIRRNFSATRLTVSTLGTLMGIAGIEHGVGEILQGNVAPSGIMFPSWPDSAFFRIVGGEPAMSLIPNLFVTGIFAIFFSLTFLVWATLFVQRKNSGVILMLLSIAMLLLGGGIFPPIIGFTIGILGTRINAPLTWWRAHLSVGLLHLLGKVWRESFTICLIAWLLLFPGINVFGFFFGVNDPNLTILLIFLAFGSLLLTIFTGFAQDSQAQMNSPQASLVNA